MKKGGTVEINHSNFLCKINTVKKLFDVSGENTVPQLNKTTKKSYDVSKKMVDEVIEEYEIRVIDILSSYYGEGGEKNDRKLTHMYNTHVISEDYKGRLNQFVEYVSLQNKNTHNYCKRIDELVKEFNRTLIYFPVSSVDYTMCPCGAKMKIYSNTSELICPACGNIVLLYGTVFEDTQFYGQEGQRSKHGRYDPSRRCKFWINCIQAKKIIDIPDECIEKVKKYIKRDKITDKRKLSCKQVRLYLKETRYTDFNDYTPYIRKKITKISPPLLTSRELRKVNNIFNRAINAFDIVKPSHKSNTPYHPYIIYKILDSELENGNRKLKILECIHLQSRDTLISNDLLWKKICNIIPGIDYSPTDKSNQKLYI